MNIMKRNRIKSLWLGIGTLALLSSCNTMDTKPFESYDEELVWGNFQTADAFVVKTYQNTVEYFCGNSAIWENRTPNGAYCDQVSGDGIDFTATETGIDSYTNHGFGRFAEQRKCNKIIEMAMNSNSFSEDERKRLLGEGYFLRAILYFDMTRKMGRFVPITKVLGVDDKEDFKTPLTSSESESYKLIMDDINKSIDLLPETSHLSRVNKYTAIAFRSRIALQAYAYTKDDSYLDVVISSANEVINSGKYSLTDDYGSMFNNVDPESSEIIMGRYYLATDARVGWFHEEIEATPNLPVDDLKAGSKDGTSSFNPGQTFNGWACYFPTQDLVDQYLVIDEKTGLAVPWYESSQIRNNVDFLPTDNLSEGCIETFTRYDGGLRHIPTIIDLKSGRTDYENVLYNMSVKPGCNRDISDLMYLNRDKRMDATIIRDKTFHCKEYMEMNMGGSASQGVRAKEDGGWYTTATGYYWRKYLVPIEPQIESAAPLDFHYVIIRLGEMYMNLAEAYLYKGMIAEAVNSLNKTRTVHGGLPESRSSSAEKAWEDYIRERRVEMAYEEADIYFSYLRWGKYGSYANEGRKGGDVIVGLNAPVHKISITSDRKKAVVNQLNLLNSWSRKFTVKRYLFPIPQGEIDKRSAAGIIDKQNKGW